LGAIRKTPDRPGTGPSRRKHHVEIICCIAVAGRQSGPRSCQPGNCRRAARPQSPLPYRHNDIGGYHIAFYVDDIRAADDYLKANKVRTMMGPVPVDQGPAAGQSILYFMAPWGLQFEAISYPKGMAYEKEGGTVLWSPRDPAK